MNEVLSLVKDQPWWVIVPGAVVATGGSIIVISAAARASMILAQRTYHCCCRATDALTQRMVGACIGITNAALGALRLLFWLAMRPGVAAVDAIRDSAITAASRLEMRRAEDRALREEWNKRFRTRFPTYREFLQAYRSGDMSGGAGAQEKKQQPPDAYRAACRTLGLDPDASFTRQDMDRQYRRMMGLAHPDAGGSNARASALNGARNIISKQRGWKK